MHELGENVIELVKLIREDLEAIANSTVTGQEFEWDILNKKNWNALLFALDSIEQDTSDMIVEYEELLQSKADDFMVSRAGT